MLHSAVSILHARQMPLCPLLMVWEEEMNNEVSCNNMSEGGLQRSDMGRAGACREDLFSGMAPAIMKDSWKT